jgi:hypothetical protein
MCVSMSVSVCVCASIACTRCRQKGRRGTSEVRPRWGALGRRRTVTSAEMTSCCVPALASWGLVTLHAGRQKRDFEAQMPPTQSRQVSCIVKMQLAREVGLKNPPGSAQKLGRQWCRHHLWRQGLPQLLPCTRRGDDTARVVTGGENKGRLPASAQRTRARMVTGRVEVNVQEKPQKGQEQISLF